MALLMGLPTIAPAELRRRMAEASVELVDVNPLEGFRAARIPGARQLDPDGFAAGDLPADRDRSIVFYCANPLCTKAPRAARRAVAFGHRDVRVLSAGIRGWIAAGLPVASGAER